MQRDVPAIVITGGRSADVRQKAAREAAHGINKPINPASLRALTTQWQVQRIDCRLVGWNAQPHIRAQKSRRRVGRDRAGVQRDAAELERTGAV